MLYETSSQSTTFLFLFFIGVLAGFIFDFAILINCFFKKNNITKHILYFLSTILIFFIFSKSNLLLNFGQIRFFCILAFMSGLLIERLTLGKMFAKLVDKCYTFIVNILKRVGVFVSGRKKKKNN